MKFAELSDAAKKTAIESINDENYLSYDWWDFIIDDVKAVGKILGIQIDNVYFSGFSSQGDGACFEGRYSYEKGSVKAIKEYAPKDEELHKTAKDLYELQRPAFYRIETRVKHQGRDSNEYCTEFSTELNTGAWTTDEQDEELKRILRSFMQWIYKRLEAEYKYLISDEAIIEHINTNDYDFDEDGKPE